MRTVGNAVGSLTEVQRDIIVGSLLGDGAMRCKTNALLEINHSIKQRTYVDWKYSQLMNLTRTPPRSRNCNGGRIAYRFVTRSLPELTPFHTQFYVNGRKTIPSLQLSPLALAVWFMDDGSRSRTAVYLNTQQFSTWEQQFLIQLLQEQWGLKSALNKDRDYYRIRLSTLSSRAFAKIVTPTLLPEFRYKLPHVTP